MIEKITIKNVASYDAKGVKLENLKKVNFIYGTNGCGKTTISNLLLNPSRANFENCQVEWKNGVTLQTLVYNKEFRDKNFGSGHIQGVFTLGQASKEELEAIETKRVILLQKREQYNRTSESLEAATMQKAAFENSFKENVWNSVFKRFEKTFEKAFLGLRGNKELFKARLILESKTNDSVLLSQEDLAKKTKTLFGEKPRRLEKLKLIIFERGSEIETAEIWLQSIIGKADVPIGELIQSLNINDWVRQGKSYIQSGQTCPFCQHETITHNFKEQLEAFFDENYTKSIERINELKLEYETINLSLFQQIESTIQIEQQNPISKLDINGILTTLNILKGEVKSNIALVSQKENEPSKKIKLEANAQLVQQLQTFLLSANEEIDRHNRLTENFEQEQQQLIKQIWRFCVDFYKVEIADYEQKLIGKSKAVENLSQKKRTLYDEGIQLKNEISEDQKNVTSVQSTVDEINRLLRAFGFTNFQIVNSERESNRYQIQREDGTIAESTLSEGEVTFITFLYFMQLSKGALSESDLSNERILVIDDPISSLDSNVLFIVSSMIKKLIENIKNNQGLTKQLFILTHNVYFHKEVAFLGSRKSLGNDASFWILRKQNNTTSIQCYGSNTPILNSYELLWKELNNETITSGLTIQNTLRRIIENYFKILGQVEYEDLIEKFDTEEEKMICKSLVSWINEGSHTLPDDHFVEMQDDTIAKYRAVFKGVFEKMGHGGHYEMMMKATAQQTQSAN